VEILCRTDPVQRQVHSTRESREPGMIAARILTDNLSGSLHESIASSSRSEKAFAELSAFLLTPQPRQAHNSSIPRLIKHQNKTKFLRHFIQVIAQVPIPRASRETL